jgi:hypothetical protein
MDHMPYEEVALPLSVRQPYAVKPHQCPDGQLIHFDPET